MAAPAFNRTRWQCAVVLAYLVRQEEGCTMTAMGDALGTDHTTLWGLLDRLQKAGAAQRVPLADAGEISAATSRRVPRALYYASRATLMAMGGGRGV